MTKHPQWLRFLAADIDGTIIGDDLGEEQFRQWITTHQDVCLTYVTGRQLESVWQLIDSGRIPHPHFICSSVGSTLIDCNDPNNSLGFKYTKLAGSQWNRTALIKAGTGDGVTDQGHVGMQNNYHAAFFWDGRPESLSAFQKRLQSFKNINIIASHNSFIDVLPANLGKGSIVTFLVAELSINPNMVLLAGDSENDIAMLDTGFPAIIPANACAEIRLHKNAARFYLSPFIAGQGLVDGLHHFWD